MNDEKFVEVLAEAYRLDQPRPVEWCKVLDIEDPVPVVVMRTFADELRHESTYDAQNSASVATGIKWVDK